MTKMFRILTAMALVGAMAAPARAGTATANLTVSANVAANCTITTTALDFGSYDPIVANKSVARDGEGSVKVTCTTGSPVTITLDQGVNADTGSTDDAPKRRLTDGVAFLAYHLFSDSVRTIAWGGTSASDVGTTGSGIEETLTVYGQIPADQNVPTGDYADTVVATVAF